MKRIIGKSVSFGLPKPNLTQEDPAKGDYVKGKSEFLDATLTMENKAADAKAVGDAFGAIEEGFFEIISQIAVAVDSMAIEADVQYQKIQANTDAIGNISAILDAINGEVV